MPKVKIPRKSTNIDMTAMCDVAFLLLTFFMLATKFKSPEPVAVTTPKSVSELIVPDKDILLITIDKEGKVYFSIDNPKMRKELIEGVNTAKNLGLTENEKISFANGASIGVPFSNLKSFLNMEPSAVSSMKQPGIPIDTTFSSDEAHQDDLTTWIMQARYVNSGLRICIKADKDANYPMVQKVLKVFENMKIHKFNMLSSLEAVPEGTVLYKEIHTPKTK